MAVQVVERFVGNDAGRHVHDVTFGDGLGLGVAVERRAEQRDGCGAGVAVNATNN